MFVYLRHKYKCPNVRHMICDYHYLCLCIRDINTGSIMFNISSMIIVLHVFVLQRLKPCPWSSTDDIWSSFFIVCFTDINNVSLMFGRWSMISILHMCVLQTSYRVLVVSHTIYDLPSICLRLPEFNSVLFVRHFICEHRCFCLCHQEINTVPLTFDISSIIRAVYIRVLQR